MDDGIRVSPWIYRLAFVLLASFALAAGALLIVTEDAAPPLPAIASGDGLTLVVFETESCPWCKRFRRETATDYERSSRAGRAPLRYLHVSAQRDSGYRLKSNVRSVPTFVLIGSDGAEIDRIVGYPGGGDVFMAAVDRMLAKAN